MKRIYISFCFMMLVLISSAQNFTGGFNFRLPPFDSTSQLFLPEFHNEIIDDTSFVKTDHPGNFTIHGKPVKFWGFNITGNNFCPDKDKAPGIAGRLRKMGINIVRLVQFDNRGGLFLETPDTRVFNTANLDKLEYFISQLRDNGIYLHLTLLSLRKFCAADGVIDADSMWLEWNPNKAVPLFDPQLIKLQKEYASQLLTHVNPYTGKALVDDPVLATIEIVNENSLFQWWRQEWLKPIKIGGIFPYYYSKELDTLWNNFLSQKYITMQALTESWSAGSATPPPEMLSNGDFEAPDILDTWKLYLVDNAQATLTKDNSASHSGNSSAKVVTTNYDGTDWHIMFVQDNLTFKKDSVYTLEFWAKADKNTSINAIIKRNDAPFTIYDQKEFLLTSSWQKFRMSAMASEDNTGQGNIMINPNENCTIWLDDMSLKNTGPVGIESGEDFSAYTIFRNEYKFINWYSKKRINDLMEFYTKVQADYFNGMRDYLRNDLGVKVPIEGTNYLVGPEDLIVLKNMDFVDNHSYWDHPVYSGEWWSPTNWTIKNESMLYSADANTITYLFNGFQLKDKPYVVGEYNHLNPNRYQTEMLPIITGYSSFQGADAIMFFCYNDRSPWDYDCITFFADIHTNNATMANSPVFAYAFRNNLIKEASSQIELNYSTADLYTTLKPNFTLYSTSNFYPMRLALTNKIVTSSLTESQSTLPSELPAEPTNPYLSSTGELTWDNNGIYTIETDQLINFTGFLNNFPDKSLTNATLVSADKFGTVTWLALDDTILAKSRKSLITISTRQQNTGMIWDGTTTIHDQWGTPPTEIEPMNITLTLSIEADSIRIYPLNTLGACDYSKYYSYKPVSSNRYTITLDQNTDKTCWYGVSTYKDGSSVTAIDEKILKGDCLIGNYPNPFSEKTTIRYILSENSDTELRIIDMSGHEIFQSRQENENQGEHEIKVEAHSLKAGVYLYTLKTNIATYNSKMIVIK